MFKLRVGVSVLFFLFNFSLSDGQVSSRRYEHAVFGVPRKWVDYHLPTCLDVARHFLWTYAQMQSEGGGRVTQVAVAVKVFLI